MKLWKLKQSFMNSYLDKYKDVFLCTNEIVREVFHYFGEKKKKASLQNKPSDLEQNCAENSCTEKCSEHCQGHHH